MAPKLEKRSGLTLEKLASYDDVITDALVDKVYYWTAIRKNRGGRFSASRGLHEEDIANILRTTVILEKDPAEAVQKLLHLLGLRKYVNSLKDDNEKDQFARHLRKYVNIYMPDCPFEVTTTNRYTISEHEASVTARKDIRKGEEIKYLTGVQVAMTEEQEKTLDLARKDFSIVISSRKKTRSLFLGPARFANHDCDANARLCTKGYDGMQIVAVKNIEVGEEITVSYGEDYFGDDNEECLCLSCEKQLVNGWAPFKPVEEDEEDGEEDEQAAKNETPAPDERLTSNKPYSFRRKRKYDDPESASDSRDATPTAKKTRLEVPHDPHAKTSRLLSSKASPVERRPSHQLREKALKKAHSTSSLRQEVPISSIEDPSTNLPASSQTWRDFRTQQRVGLLAVTLDETSSSTPTTPNSSTAAGSPKSSQSTDATSVDEDSAMSSTDEKIKVESDTIVVRPRFEITTVETQDTKRSSLDDDVMSELSELSSSQELDDVLQEIVRRKRSRTPPVPRTTRSQSQHTSANRLATPTSLEEPQEGYVENTRKPGDYTLTDALLSAKYSRWVECHTCDDHFVQFDAYHTRKECPRCERHSKLYGFAWPKTDKEGKHDREERILDHRTVHRFVDADEERTIKKGGRKALQDYIAARYSTPQSIERETSMSVEVESGRKRKRVRKTM
ncbi:uncharacterized protein BDR25DRAFT_864 [Lindgomyces ingoldianus]|uniref:Uncharacterized protein n=1 Tax=Lindgomyces ingoldianus TaxID=673940 RepID=A0ACB6RF96_9PLEO|nr:uncharacterized protein BDR25DRAFT_864 [Lindgomyces ingoldianus]KAF2477428.1 hypothetical protein BDR25DRAFT_864 [Lindgomyces ingoldianus]